MFNWHTCLGMMLNQELYSEVGRLETMIRHVEARVMAHVEENKHENA